MPRRSKRSKPSSRGVVAEVHRVVEHLRRGGRLEERALVVEYRGSLWPPAYTAAGVKRARERMKMSQAVFARFLAVSPRTVQNWEQGRGAPPPIACRLLEAIEAEPDWWTRHVLGRRVAP